MQNRVINVWINVARGTPHSSCEIMKAAGTKRERATLFTCPCFMKPVGNFSKSSKILLCSQKWKHAASTKLAVVDVLHWAAQKYIDVLLRFLKAISSWFPHRNAEMKQLLYHHSSSSSSSLPLFHFCLERFGDLQTNAWHARRAHFTVEVDFYFMLTHLLDVIIEILGYLVEPPVSSSLVPVDCLHHLREGLLKGCLHIETVYIVLSAPLFKGFFFPSLHRGLACEGRQIGVWAVTRLLFWKVQTSLGWSRREGDRGMGSEWEAWC